MQDLYVYSMLRHLNKKLPLSLDEVTEFISKYQTHDSEDIEKMVRKFTIIGPGRSGIIGIKKPKDDTPLKLIDSIFSINSIRATFNVMADHPRKYYSVDEVMDEYNYRCSTDSSYGRGIKIDGFDNFKKILISLFITGQAMIGYDSKEENINFCVSKKKVTFFDYSPDNWEYYKFPDLHFTKDDLKWEHREEKVIELVKKLQDPLCEHLFASECLPDIFLTEELSQSIRNVEELTTFSKGITLLLNHFEKWCREDLIRPCSDAGYNYDQNYKFTPIILGTVDEVIKRRDKIKAITSDEELKEDLCKLKLKLIHAISSHKSCFKLDEIKDLMQKYEQMCEKLYNKYAYYKPQRCLEDIETLNIVSKKNTLENENKYAPGIKKQSFKSDYIVLPYDINEESELIFTPKFYQALYHELFHSLVINRYRGSDRINEGLPELYSELCFYTFVKEFIATSPKENDFFESYMKFRTTGAYLSYYNSVKKQFGYREEHDQLDEYKRFCNFICDILKESRMAYKAEDIDLNSQSCKFKTPHWNDIFKEACKRSKERL